MVKCDNCGKKISLETLRCPDCNTINAIAEEHFRELANYDRTYEKALHSVYRHTAEYRSYMMKFALIGLLLIVTFMSICFAKSPRDVLYDVFLSHGSFAQTQNDLKDEKLLIHDYYGYYSLHEDKAKYMPSEHDHKVIDAMVVNYVRIFQTLNSLPHTKEVYGARENLNSFDLLASDAELIASTMTSFDRAYQIMKLYEKCQKEETQPKVEELEAIWPAFSSAKMADGECLTLQISCVKDMRNRIDELLCYFLDFTPDEIEELWQTDMSTRNYILETKIKEAYHD